MITYPAVSQIYKSIKLIKNKRKAYLLKHLVKFQ